MASHLRLSSVTVFGLILIHAVSSPVLASDLADNRAVVVRGGADAAVEGEANRNQIGVYCKDEISNLVKPEKLATAYPLRVHDPLAVMAFAPFECEVPVRGQDAPLTIKASLQPLMTRLTKPAPNSGVSVIFENARAQILTSQDEPKRIKASSLAEIDNIPLLFEANADTVAAAKAFVEITAQFDARAVRIAAGWRRHIGMFRNVKPVGGASEYYEYSEPENPFLEGILNSRGDIVIKPEYDDIDFARGNFIVQTKEGLTGLLSLSGKTILAVQHKAIIDKGDGRFLVFFSDYNQQVFDADELEFIGQKYDFIEFIEGENLVIVKNVVGKDDAHYRFLTRDMAPAFGGIYDLVRQMPDSKFLVEAGGAASLLDRDGNALIPPDFESLWPHAKHRLIYARKGNTAAYFDYDGRQISPKNWTVHYAPSEEKGYVTVSNPEGRYGVIDKNGMFVIPAEYAQVHQFNEGYLPAAKIVDDKAGKRKLFGLVDEKNKVIIPFEYDNLNLVRDGRLWAKKDGKWGLIGIDQSIIADFTIDAVSRSITERDDDSGQDRSFMIAQRNGQYGIVRHDSGEVVVPFRYSAAQEYPLKLRKDDQWLSYPCDFKPELEYCKGGMRPRSAGFR
ncbi:WG repeat-containing protein [Sphingorhabdus arenilitoris]|uniref:WG repeat-containing protein n=1 Tax=Sphingorhabdus arenilitoris TaxID=1490041 RepID=A0ABV8RGK7_9SPHN